MGELQSLFKESGCTLTEISKLSGVSLSTTYKYINGQVKNPNPDYYEPIYKVLSGIHIEDDETEEEIEEEIIEKIETIAKKEIDSEKKKVIKESMQRIIDVQASDSEYSDEIGIDPNKIKTAIEGNALKSNNSITAMNTTTTTVPAANNYITTAQKPIRKGDVWYVKNNYATGSEQAFSRPCLVISSDKLNAVLDVYTVVYLTSQEKAPLPNHVAIKTSRDSIVLCEQPTSVSRGRFVNFLSHISDAEMEMVERGVLMTLGISYKHQNINDSHDYLRLQVENRMLKDFNENLISILNKK